MSAEDKDLNAAGNVSATDSEPDQSEDSHGSPSKKRKRNLKISCELCKARKVKCDRAEPSCGWCARNNRMCVYQERKKPGLRIAYVQELEDKVNRLEAVLFSLGRRVEDHISEHDVLYQRNSNQLAYAPSMTPHSDIPRSIPSETISLRSPTMDGQWQPNGYSRDQRLPESISLRSTIDPAPPDPRPQHFQRPRALTSTSVFETTQPSTDAELPPYDLVYNLVDLFFKHINPWSPILDRKSTFDTLFGGAVLLEPDQVLLHAIVATTLRFSKDPRLTPESRQRYHDSCKTKILLHGIQHPSIEALQAMLILAIDLIGSSCDGSGMNLLALITRNIVHLGLGIEKAVFLGQPNYHAINTPLHLSQTQPRSWIEDEGRRRLVWMAYILDRYTTVSTCSTFVFDDSDMDRRLPCTYDLFSRNQFVPTRFPHHTHHLDSSSSQPEHLGSFSYHCEVLTILSRVHNFLRQPLDLYSPSDLEAWRHSYTELDSELNAWLSTLPGEYGKISQLCHSDPGSKISNWIMLHAAFVTAVIRLHSAAAYPTAHSHLFTPSFNAMQRCLGAVESLREIAQDTISNSMLDLLGPPFAFSLWTSARLLLVHAAIVDLPDTTANATGSVQSGVDYPTLHFFISTLSAMGQHWRVAAVYAETLNRVVVEGQQALSLSPQHMTPTQQNTGNDVPGRPRTFKQMRKQAYELSVQLSRKVPSNPNMNNSTSAFGYSPEEAVGQSQVRIPEANEMEYLDVFEFFNYPLVTGDGRGFSEISVQDMIHGNGIGNGNGRGNGNGNGNGNGEGSVSGGLAAGGAGVPGPGAGRPTLTQSPTCMMPTRESDWLGFQPPRE